MKEENIDVVMCVSIHQFHIILKMNIHINVVHKILQNNKKFLYLNKKLVFWVLSRLMTKAI